MVRAGLRKVPQQRGAIIFVAGVAPRDDRAPIALSGPDRAPIASSRPDRAPIAPSGPDRAPIAPSGPNQGEIALSLVALL